LIPSVLANPGVANECTTAERTLLTPFGEPLPPLPCRFDPRALRCRKGASRDWCRCGGFAGGKRNDQFSGGVGRWYRLVGVLGGLGSTRAGRFSQIARWEWCNSARCASANGPCVQECNSISVQFRATKPGGTSTSGAVRTDPEEYSLRQSAALEQFSTERVRLCTLRERVWAHFRGTGELPDTV
jgi:hypothetical protein